MLSVNQSDFMAYMAHSRRITAKASIDWRRFCPTRPMAEVCRQPGGVSVVLGVPIELPDRNSDKLLELLLGSDVADDAVLTWMHQFYEFTDWNDLLSDASRWSRNGQ